MKTYKVYFSLNEHTGFSFEQMATNIVTAVLWATDHLMGVYPPAYSVEIVSITLI